MISPYSQYPSGHQDVFGSLMQGADASRGLEVAQKRSQLGAQSRDFAQRYALQGLQNEIDQQSQRNNLIQNRMDGAFGPLGNLLRGLYQ
jgi:hypothetical protein